MSLGSEDTVVIVHSAEDLETAWALKRAAMSAGCPADDISLASTVDERIARETLAGAKQVVLVLTLALLRSRSLPRLLGIAARQGSRVSLLLGSHADHQPVVGSRETLHDPRLALDALPNGRQEPVFAQAGERLRRLQLDPDHPPLAAPPPREEGFGVSIAFLGQAIAGRHQRAALWRKVAGHLAWGALALVATGLMLGLSQAGWSLPGMLVLAAGFFLSVAFTLRCRARMLADGATTLSYVRGGLLDPRLPVRQSAPLLQRAASLPGVKRF